MLLGARLQAVIEIIDIVFHKNIPADRACLSYFRANRFVGSHDRRFIGDLVFDIFRGWALFAWSTDFTPIHSSRLCVFLYGLHKKLWSLEELNSHLEKSQRFISSLTPKEKRQLEESLAKIQFPNTLPLWVKYSYPQWIEPLLQQSLSNKFVEEIASFLTTAPMTIRINILKTQRDYVLDQLVKEGFDVKPTTFSPWGITFSNRDKINDHTLFQNGYFEVQDESSQLCTLFVNPQSDDQVLDFCAGAGGKTLALAALMGNKGTIIATDVDAFKLQEAKKRIRRAGIYNTQCRLLDTEGQKWLSRQKQRFDKVLVDAPCSGSGTWRRNPDAKWKLQPKDLEELQQKQRTILDNSAQLVRPGGELVYATCSILEQENFQQVEWFLKTHPEFFLITQHNAILSPELFHQGCLRLLPNCHKTDGFFGAKFQKQK